MLYVSVRDFKKSFVFDVESRKFFQPDVHFVACFGVPVLISARLRSSCHGALFA